LFGKSFRKIFLDTLCGDRTAHVENRTQTCMNELGVSNGNARKKSGETFVSEPVGHDN
jgi:hypothetical protein